MLTDQDNYQSANLLIGAPADHATLNWNRAPQLCQGRQGACVT